MKKCFTFFFLLFFIAGSSQVVSGPMLGPVELRDARIWIEVEPSVKNLSLVYNKKGEKKKTTIPYKGSLGKAFNPVGFTVGGLQFNTTYQYEFLVDGKSVPQKGQFTTKDLWQYRKPVPDFSFLTGSCAFFNEKEFDRPGRGYGGDSSIFLTMAKEKADFMLWLGDNWYTREVDYYSEWGLWYRPHHDRKQPALQPLLKAMSHLAIWDDHDFGPNDIGTSYHLKEESREVFKNYWLNKNYGLNGEGIYTKYSHADADFFLLDNRWWRSQIQMKDSVNGRPNPDKIMLGKQQMEWLKQSLLYSNATFKIIANGSQMLNRVSPWDDFTDFPAEYHELMDFIEQYKIEGVLFLSGDRHHSEVIKLDRPGSYPLYDITVSPLTSGTYKFSGPEANNPMRVLGIDGKRNYGRITISGDKGKRKLSVDFIDPKGQLLSNWSVSETDLKLKGK